MELSAVKNKIVGFFGSVYHVAEKEFPMLSFCGSSILKGLEGVGAVVQGNPVGKLIFSIAGIVNTFLNLSIIPGLPKAGSLYALKKDIFENVKDPTNPASRETKIKDLTASCAYVSANERRIRKTINIAKDVGIQKRANDVIQGLASNDSEEQTKAIEKGEKFTKALRHRVKNKLGIDIVKLVNKISGIVISILLLALPPNPVTLSLAGVVGLSSLTLWAVEKILLPADPFSEPKDVWYERVPRKLLNATYRVSEVVNNLFTPKKQAVPTHC